MTAPSEVLETLRRHLLVDGFDLVLDTVNSSGTTLVDARDGTRYLDMFTFFASSALGMNHPGLMQDPAFLARLREVAINKPSNSDVYSTHLASFVETFERTLGDPALPRLFLVEGGAVAVENALKVAFDWKSRHNGARGRDERRGTKVLHLTQAFHGRTGYTLSLTNTDPVKTARFPTFGWPRIDVPAQRFPLQDHGQATRAAEDRALTQAEEAFRDHPDDIACFIAEPIQGEGGDNHLSARFLQEMQRLCRRHDALFVLDEVQTGCGLTGSAWAYQQLGLEPDLVAFGKKLQVCGVMGGRRVTEISDNAFAVSGRLNSTWGGNLTDMVRAEQILRIIENDALIARAEQLGKHLRSSLEALADEHPRMVSNPRGRGLMCAFDLPAPQLRDQVLERLRADERILIVGSGPSAVRFRPALVVTEEALDAAVRSVHRVLSRSA